MSRISDRRRRIGQAAAAVAVVAAFVALPYVSARTSAEAAHAAPVPAPAADEAPGAAGSETAVFAGGCFWGVQGVFQHVDGVTSAVSGYAGGEQKTAEYETVSTGRTGHAESVRVTFDPHKISYGQLLRVFFSVAHDPTEVNRQGPDSGTQYRSAVFPVSAEQGRVAAAYITQLDHARVFGAPIATKIEPDRAFYPAEAYHQDYLNRHPNNPYIVYNDLPKVEMLKQAFPQLYRADPVLVAASN